jgi:predicted choloylglycine hydrolase
MQLHYNSISESVAAGPKWYSLFNRHWPAYLNWLNSRNDEHSATLEVSVNALKRYMPEMLHSYYSFCHLIGNQPIAHQFLTGFQPPAYVSGCSQLVTVTDKVTLIRNYDYHPALMEGTLLKSAWNGKQVMAMGDSLIGIIDGINEDGLAISQTFGGRKIVGTGFGIPFIMRYVLEFCSNVDQAVAALCRIPSHMCYNVTAVDKTGHTKTVQLAPDRAPLVTDAVFTTNHQEEMDWPENAAFNKTYERSAFLKRMTETPTLTTDEVIQTFLVPPLYNIKFTKGFGTLFTSVYCPTDGSVQLHWPEKFLRQTFDDFQEATLFVNYNPAIAEVTVLREEQSSPLIQDSLTNDFTSYLGS